MIGNVVLHLYNNDGEAVCGTTSNNDLNILFGLLNDFLPKHSRIYLEIATHMSRIKPGAQNYDGIQRLIKGCYEKQQGLNQIFKNHYWIFFHNRKN